MKNEQLNLMGKKKDKWDLIKKTILYYYLEIGISLT